MRLLKLILFTFVFIGGILFYVWAGILWIALIIIIIGDFISLKILLSSIKKYNNLHTCVKYSFFSLLPFLLIFFVRIFFFDVFIVPSSSMEKTLMPKDYLLINKFKYGTKISKKNKSFILKKTSFFNSQLDKNKTIKILYKFNSFSHDDVVVFKSKSNNKKKIVKRIVGLPGDIINSLEGDIRINDKQINKKKEYVYSYYSNESGNIKTHKNMSNREWNSLSKKQKDKWARNTKKNSGSKNIFNNNDWDINNFGPILIPKKGMTISIDIENISLYKDVIDLFEKTEIKIPENGIIKYTFQKNYFFLMGDNRHNSYDSRHYGFIPEEYLLGKVIYIF